MCISKLCSFSSSFLDKATVYSSLLSLPMAKLKCHRTRGINSQVTYWCFQLSASRNTDSVEVFVVRRAKKKYPQFLVFFQFLQIFVAPSCHRTTVPVSSVRADNSLDPAQNIFMFDLCLVEIALHLFCQFGLWIRLNLPFWLYHEPAWRAALTIAFSPCMTQDIIIKLF